MKYKINKITYKDKVTYEPLVCKKYKRLGWDRCELVETWDRIIAMNSIITDEFYYDKLPLTEEEAMQVIKDWDENLKKVKAPIVETIKEFEL
jgi:hypothetical protein